VHGNWIQQAWFWIEVHTGTLNEPGPYYGFFSGVGSDLGEIVLVGAVIQWYRLHHTTASGHRLCKVHIAKPNSELQLHAVHSDHLPPVHKPPVRKKTPVKPPLLPNKPPPIKRAPPK
jgi:hypothetical protein